MRKKRYNAEDNIHKLREVQVLIERWYVHYIRRRPHSAPGYRLPAPETIFTETGTHRPTASRMNPYLNWASYCMKVRESYCHCINRRPPDNGKPHELILKLGQLLLEGQGDVPLLQQQVPGN